MREIKFRIKRKFYDLYDKYIETKWEIITLEEGIMDVSNCLMKTLGQFTGLKDKNGVEIYENDEVKFRFDATTLYAVAGNTKQCHIIERIGIVTWFENGFYGLVNTRVGGFIKLGNIAVSFINGNCTEFEVVGNIHQIKEEKK